MKCRYPTFSDFTFQRRSCVRFQTIEVLAAYSGRNRCRRCKFTQCAMDPSVGRQVQKTTALQRLAAECGLTSTACGHCMLFAARLLATDVQVDLQTSLNSIWLQVGLGWQTHQVIKNALSRIAEVTCSHGTQYFRCAHQVMQRLPRACFRHAMLIYMHSAAQFGH